MELPNIPSKEQALQELQTLTDSLYDFFPRIAAEEVVPYFSRRGRPVNARLATDILRYEAHWHLTRLGIEVNFEDDSANDSIEPGVSLNWLANNGIEGTFANWAFKLLRSRNGEVPRPGASVRRREFFSQQPWLMPPDSEDGVQLRPNVVLLWDFDAEYTEVSLRLAVPREVSYRNGYVRCYYNVPVQRTDGRTSEPFDITGFPQLTFDEGIVEPEVTWKKPQNQDNDSINQETETDGV